MNTLLKIIELCVEREILIPLNRESELYIYILPLANIAGDGFQG